MDSYLIINNRRVDLIDGADIPVSHSYDSVDDLLKVVRNSSIPFSMPSTTNNNRFFETTYDLNYRELTGNIVKGKFNATRLYDCQYYRNGVLEMNGSFQFLGVKKTLGVMVYSGVLFSRVVALMKGWKDLLVSELDWSEYDHELNHTNMENSWDTSVIVNGSPVSNFSAGIPDGFGYLYGPVDYGFWNSEDEFYDNDIIPQVYYKEIFEKAFEYLGYTIDSSFMDTERFKRMTLGYGGGDKFQLTALQLAELVVELTGDGTFNFSQLAIVNTYQPDTATFFISGQFPLLDSNNDFTITTVSDPSSQSDGGEITIPVSGNYRFTVAFDLTIDIAGTSSGTKDILSQFRVFISVNGVNKFMGLEVIEGEVSGSVWSFSSSIDLHVNSGDIIKPDLYVQTSGTVIDSTGNYGTISIDGDFNNTYTFDQECIDSVIENGSTVYLSTAMTPMTVQEFIQGVCSQYKLYMSEPDENNVVIIEPLEDFYVDNATRDDWTYKIDTDSPIEIEPLAINQPKWYRWKFKDDQDYYRKTYFDLYKIGYGDYYYQNPSFFAQGESVLELPFTISPPVLLENSGLIIPRIIQKTNGVVKPFRGNPRVYYYQGLVTGDWTILGTNSASDSAQTSYPALHHLDDTENPTFDILFGTPRQVFYTATDYTTSNMISNYHWRFIEEVVSADSKLLKAYAFLDNNDVRKDTLRTVKLIDGVLYRCKLIDDYVFGKPTKIQLIKILETKSKATFLTGTFVDAKQGQFESQDPTDTEYGSRSVDVTTTIAVTNKYDLYNCETSGGDVYVFLSKTNMRQNHWFSIRHDEGSTGGNEVIIQSDAKLINGQTEVRIKYPGNSFSFKFDGDKYTIN